jgi:hypothetical protein
MKTSNLIKRKATNGCTLQEASVSANSFLQTAARYGGVVSDQLPPIPPQLLAHDLPVSVSVQSFRSIENLGN